MRLISLCYVTIQPEGGLEFGITLKLTQPSASNGQRYNANRKQQHWRMETSRGEKK